MQKTLYSRSCICIVEVVEVSEQEEEPIYKKKLKISKESETYHVRFYCRKCHNELMWTTEFYDVASSVVHETADCKHYEWVTTRAHPQLADPEDWRYQLERPFIDSIKDRIVYVYTATSNHYVLLKKMPKES